VTQEARANQQFNNDIFKSREQNYYSFAQLLELWKLDLATGSISTNAFVEQHQIYQTDDS